MEDCTQQILDIQNGYVCCVGSLTMLAVSSLERRYQFALACYLHQHPCSNGSEAQVQGVPNDMLCLTCYVSVQMHHYGKV